MNDQLRKAWMKADKIESDTTPDQAMKEVRAMIERDETRVRRIKWVVIAAWVLLAVVFVTGAMLENVGGRSILTSTLAVVSAALLTIAALMSISFWLRYARLRLNRIERALADLQAQVERLANAHER